MHTCRSEHVGSTARMATMPRRPHHQAAACTDATAHPRRGKRRTTACTSYSARSPGRCRPHRPVRHPDIAAPSARSCLPFAPSTRHTSCRHSTHLALSAVKALFRFARLPGDQVVEGSCGLLTVFCVSNLFSKLVAKLMLCASGALRSHGTCSLVWLHYFRQS